VLSTITEELADGTPRVRGQELQGRRIGSCSSHHNGVLQAVSLFEQTHNVGNGGALLTNSNVDAVEGLGVVTSLEDGLLVKDGVNGNSGFAGLSISND